MLRGSLLDGAAGVWVIVYRRWCVSLQNLSPVLTLNESDRRWLGIKRTTDWWRHPVPWINHDVYSGDEALHRSCRGNVRQPTLVVPSQVHGSARERFLSRVFSFTVTVPLGNSSEERMLVSVSNNWCKLTQRTLGRWRSLCQRD